VLNEPRLPPGTLGDMQRDIATSAARNEFNKLQSLNDKRNAESDKKITTLTKTTTQLTNQNNKLQQQSKYHKQVSSNVRDGKNYYHNSNHPRHFKQCNNKQRQGGKNNQCENQ